jgi:uncharacterized protein YwgA
VGRVEMSDKSALKTFVYFLKERVGFTFDKDNFDHRIKLQKYVFLAKNFGWKNEYNYNIYIRRHYSSVLSNDYYHLNEVEGSSFTMYMDKFKDLVINKDTAWLEVAATLLYLNKRYRRVYSGRKLRHKIIKRTFELKSTIPEDIIYKAYVELRGVDLLT